MYKRQPKEVLVTKGQKRVSGRSSNTKGNDNIISNGSGIAVADGQCMIIVEQGKIVEVCAEPGEFTYDTSTEPSIFAGSLGESIKEDVYKRQEYRSGSVYLSCSQRNWSKVSLSLRSASCYGGRTGTIRHCTCLLYTSRCV